MEEKKEHLPAQKVLITVKNWFYAVKDGKIQEFRAVCGYITNETEKMICLGDKISLQKDSIVSCEVITEELPNDSIIRNWDMKDYTEIEAKAPIYIID